jgi:hydrogenase/urease accessory protein HupE
VKLAVLCLWCVLAGVAQAHEIGTTRVSAKFHEGEFDIAVVTDASALVEKLQASTGSSSPDLNTYDDNFRKRVKIEFGGVEVRPAIAYAVEPAPDAQSASAATIHLTGRIPEGGGEFAWTFGWTFATYSLATGSDTQWIEGGDRSAPLELKPAPTVTRYLRLGFTHILPNGLDHMLFVLGIYFLSRRTRSVLLQVSAFTVAHSITLALSLYGLVSVSPAIVEPMIALSIAYVAIENLFLSELRPWRVALVFAFGLLHGLGFAGVLRELDLPRAEFAVALVAFNVGVEAGQLAVIAAAFGLFGWYCSQRDWYRTRIAVPASIAIACTAVYWTFERI